MGDEVSLAEFWRGWQGDIVIRGEVRGYKEEGDGGLGSGMGVAETRHQNHKLIIIY